MWFAEEHIGLDDNKYIGDIVAEFKTIKEKAKGELQCRLLFKKRLFRESDEAIVDPMFVQLLYVQVQFLPHFLLNVISCLKLLLIFSVVQ